MIEKSKKRFCKKGHEKVKKKSRSRRDGKPLFTLAWIWGGRGGISTSFSQTTFCEILGFWAFWDFGLVDRTVLSL